MTTVLASVAASWGVAMALAPLLQIRNMRNHRSSRGISVGYLYVLFVGFILWLAYGFELANLALIVPNIVAVIVCAMTILVARHYRR